MQRYFAKGEASIFVQMDPDQGYQLLTCTAAGNIEIPDGDVTVVRVPDPVLPGRWRRSALIQGEGDAPTVTLTRPLARVADLLGRCPMNLRFNFSCAGERAFESYDSVIVLVDARVTGRTINEPAPMEPSTDHVSADLSISAAFPLMWDRLRRYSRTATGGTGNIVDIFSAPEECPGRCSAGRRSTSVLYAVDGGGAVYRTLDGGLTWDSSVVDEGYELSAVLLMSDRVVVAGASDTDGVVAYSDDFVSWNSVTIAGAPIRSLIRDDVGRVYAAASGAVLVSATRAMTWSTALTVTGGVFNDMATDGDLVYAVGDDGLLATGRGTDWTQVTTSILDDLTTCDINANGRLVMIGGDGSVYRYYNDEIVSAGDIGAPISRMKFVFGTVGIATGSNGTFITEDGGVTWRRFDAIAGSAIYPTTSNGFLPRWVIGGASGAVYLIA